MKTININKEIDEINSTLEKIAETIYENRNNDLFYHKLEFNTNQLIDHENYTKFVNCTGELVPIFNDLNKITDNHCLYWFELENNETAEKLNEKLNSYRDKKLKKVPPTSSKKNGSNVLYVGIRQGGYTKKNNLTNITGRICQHLGYYDVPTTQGLQLYEYARNEDFKVAIKVIEFGKFKHAFYLSILEKLVAEKLSPLCGKH